MAGAEWSMHSNLDERLDPYRKRFGSRLVSKRDMVLVMGTDEQELKKHAVCATFALQTAPWRWGGGSVEELCKCRHDVLGGSG